MKLLKVESHVFLKNSKELSTSDMPDLISMFHEDELLPQYFEELISSQQRSKRLMFINPLSGKAVRFQTDRVVISLEMDPFNNSSENGVEVFSKFYEFVSRVINNLVSFNSGNFIAHRISLVTNTLNILESGEKAEVAQKLITPLPWGTEQLTELKVKIGNKCEFESINEIGNAVLSLDDGEVEQNKNGQTEFRKDCFLAIWDLNTSPEMLEPRFNEDTCKQLTQEMLNMTQDKIHTLEDFL
ncbi:hypothetical protein [Pseudoalteromonas sp.]|uniref:hypothetical protein n=1 Tax=Pseudoalteromonas sp. TaxID=53249 RepID=UPI0035157433